MLNYLIARRTIYGVEALCRCGEALRGLRLLCKGVPHVSHLHLAGVTAQVDREKCVGCGKCAKECPAGTIELRDREVGA